MAGAELNETAAVIDNLKCETEQVLESLASLYENYSKYAGANYTAIHEDVQFGLGAMVNNSLSLAELLNKTVGDNNVWQ